MKFDNIIIGGGLAGLLAGIKLQEAGQKCAIISTGQSAMHFWSGAFDVLNRLPDGTEVQEPFEAMKSLPETHPYSVIGAEKMLGYLREAAQVLETVGCKTVIPENLHNIVRMSSMGSAKPCFMAMDSLLTTDQQSGSFCKKALVAGLDGFLDFNTEFIAMGIEENGGRCRRITIKLNALKELRKSPTEMRATNISKVLSRNTIKELVSQIREKYDGEDLIVLPAIFKFADSADALQLGKVMDTKVRFVATMPPSVPGIEVQKGLTELFKKLGGTLFKGDTVTSGKFSGGRLESVRTANISDVDIKADNFILASGSFFSNGLKADRFSAFEPVFNLDITSLPERTQWFDSEDFFGKQDYMGFGVSLTHGQGFKASREGKTVENLYAAGSVLGGFNPLYEGCGGGVTIGSALAIADTILGK